jgi:hypothetical protein
MIRNKGCPIYVVQREMDEVRLRIHVHGMSMWQRFFIPQKVSTQG